MPVDAFSPKTKAKIRIMIIPIPLIPDFEIPKTKAAKPMAIQLKNDKLYD
jgi:hypothetical protein